MSAVIHSRRYQPYHHPRHRRHSTGEWLLGFALSLVPTALMIGLLWGIGYLMYLLLLNELA